MNLVKLIPLAATLVLASACASESDDEAQATVEDDAAALSQADALFAEPEGDAARYPIVLVHGNGATPTHWGMVGVEAALERDGHTVQESLSPINSSEVRAEYLAKAIDAAMSRCDISKKCDGSKVNLVAHSQGGLDARVVLSMPRFAGKIASLSTIATPHRGTSVADVLLRTTTEGIRDELSEVVDLWAKSFIPANYPSVDGDAVWKSLSTSNAKSFNERNPDQKGVFYQSWAGVSYPFAHQSLSASVTEAVACEGKILGHRDRNDWIDKTMIGAYYILAGKSHEPNDGLVTVHSAKWGQFNGCLPADHQDQVGRSDSEKADRRTGFNHIRFFRNVAFDLARRGF